MNDVAIYLFASQAQAFAWLTMFCIPRIIRGSIASIEYHTSPLLSRLRYAFRLALGLTIGIFGSIIFVHVESLPIVDYFGSESELYVFIGGMLTFFFLYFPIVRWAGRKVDRSPRWPLSTLSLDATLLAILSLFTSVGFHAVAVYLFQFV